MDVGIADEAGRLSPVEVYSPPHPCEQDCDGPPLNGCAPGSDSLKVAPGEQRTIPWDGTLRRLRRRGGQPCYERIAAPAGAYLLRLCSTDSRCGLTRFTMPRSAPVEVTLNPRNDAAPACDPATVRRAVALTLGRARLDGLTDEQLAGCASLAPGCEGPALDLEPGACRVRVAAGSGRWEVDLRPPPRDGAPLRYSVWADVDAVASGNIFREGSRWAATADGELLVRGDPRHVMHEHGGEPATLSGAPFVAYNRGDRPRTLTLRSASWLTSYGKPLALAGAGLVVEDKPASAEVTVPPRSSLRLALTFPPQRAYQSSGEHFYAEAEIVADGAVLRPQTEIHVSRFDRVRPLGKR